MDYIKELYAKKPELVKKFIKKVFKIEKDEYIVETEEQDKFLKTEGEIAFVLINIEKREAKELILEDFEIWYDDEGLEIGDVRLDAYLKFMAKVFGEKFVSSFRDYRNGVISDYISDFDATTKNMERELFEVVEKEEKRKIKVYNNGANDNY